MHAHLSQLSAKENFSACYFSYRGEWEHISEYLAFQAVWDTVKEAYFFLALLRVLSCKMNVWKVERWKRREWRQDTLGTFKGYGSYFNYHVDSIKKTPTSCWKCLTCGSLKMVHKHTQYSEHFIQTPHLKSDYVCSNGGYSELCLLNCEHTQKTDLNLWVKERP